ncbi:hypothetical protein LCGC14_1456160 [marine sediment metagenome]|uniref:Uncharacterized protein n=1 Tax=marine sediment metagenome TaxID=412755 RepID=A0A0F9K2M5_9ZZZZ
MLPVMDRLEQAKCPPSPTGVHHWMIPSTGAEPIGHCQFCGTDRQFKGCSNYDWVDYQKANARNLELALKDARDENL